MRDLVSFDCYRTLVNFDLESVTDALLADRFVNAEVSPERFNHDARVMRFQAVVQEYRPYREVLRRTLQHAMLLHGLEYRESDGEALVEAVKGFQPFPEVPAALRRLQAAGYRLAIFSNSEDDLIKYSVENIGVDFDYVATAEQARAYKPLPQAFEHLMAVTERDPDRIVHAGQGWEYDILPTRRYPGMRRVWVNRYQLSRSAHFAPYDEIRDLSGLPDLLGV